MANTERLEKLKSILIKSNGVGIKELSKELCVTEMTVRRDLKSLMETGDAVIVRGVAVYRPKAVSVEAQVYSIEDEKKEYLFLMAEFDNFRKRTIREKAELIRNGAEKALGDMLPIVDDFERAIKANENADDIDAVKEGFSLIYNKFIKYLEKNQVKAMQSTGCEFNTEMHEAVTTFPAPDESMKGKIIDTVLTGYTINNKVLRHAKVVVGQ